MILLLIVIYIIYRYYKKQEMIVKKEPIPIVKVAEKRKKIMIKPQYVKINYQNEIDYHWREFEKSYHGENGQPPNPDRAFYHLDRLIVYNYLPAKIERIKLLSQGFYTFEPDYRRARQEAETLLMNPRLPSLYRVEIERLIQMINLSDPTYKKRDDGRITPRINRVQEVIRNNGLLDDLDNYELPENNELINQLIHNDTTRVRNDSQNVHDTGVVQSIRKINETLEKYRSKNPENEIKEFMLYVNKSTKKSNVLRVLERFEEDEKNTFSSVWNYIRNKSNRNDFINVLIDNLDSGVEYGHVVCAMGRKSRIINSLAGMDETIEIKPTWAIKEEIFSIAAKIREVETEKNKNLNEEKLNQLILNKIGDRIREEYVKTDIITEGNYELYMEEIKMAF